MLIADPVLPAGAAREGAADAEVVFDRLAVHTRLPDLSADGVRLLEFGAGAGRLTVPLSRHKLRLTDACDVDGVALDRLARALPHVRCTLNAAAPPLPFAAATFDAAVALSVWTHLSPSAGALWLGELARVLKPDAVALISLCGPFGLARRRSGQAGWVGVSGEDLKRAGVLFVPLDERRYPGVAAPYGMSAYSEAEILRIFDPVLAVEAIYCGAIGGWQDLLVLRRRTEDQHPLAPSEGGSATGPERVPPKPSMARRLINLSRRFRR